METVKDNTKKVKGKIHPSHIELVKAHTHPIITNVKGE